MFAARLVDITNFMGGVNSMQYFEKCIQAVTTAMKVKFPEIYLENGRIKKVFS